LDVELAGMSRDGKGNNRGVKIMIGEWEAILRSEKGDDEGFYGWG
jgi:hypothetical protein